MAKFRARFKRTGYDAKNATYGYARNAETLMVMLLSADIHNHLGRPEHVDIRVETIEND